MLKQNTMMSSLLTFYPGTGLPKKSDQEQQNFETILENAGLSKFRTLKLFLVKKANFKAILTYDIIIPKANKHQQFAPLIELAEKELDNQQEENNQLSGEEYHILMKELFHSALQEVLSANSESDYEDDTTTLHNHPDVREDFKSQLSSVAGGVQSSLGVHSSFMKKIPKEEVTKQKKESRMKILQNPYCYLSTNQLIRDLTFKSFNTLDYCQLYNKDKQPCENFYEIPNSHRYAFLADFDTITRAESKLNQFIENFEQQSQVIKIKPLIENLPCKNTQELQLLTFRIRDQFYDEDDQEKSIRDRKFKELTSKIKKRIFELYQGNPHAKIETAIPMLPVMPKCIYSSVGSKRKLFRDAQKDKGRAFSPSKKNDQLKFNEVRLTPKNKTSTKNIKIELPKINDTQKALKGMQFQTQLGHSYSLSTLKSSKIQDYQKPNYRKRFEIEMGLVNSKLGRFIGSPIPQQMPLTSASSIATLVTSTKNDNPVDLFGMGSQTIQRNKKKMSNFLYNKSKFIRNLIIANKSLSEAMSMFHQYISSNPIFDQDQSDQNTSSVKLPITQVLHYQIEEFESICRLFYVFNRCYLEGKSLEVHRAILGNVPLEKISESEFSQYLSKFDGCSRDYSIDLRSVLNHHKQIKKIDKRVLERILDVLNIKVQEPDIDEDQRPINFDSYLKLRYFFVDKKASNQELITLIQQVILLLKLQLFMEIQEDGSVRGMNDAQVQSLLKASLAHLDISSEDKKQIFQAIWDNFEQFEIIQQDETQPIFVTSQKPKRFIPERFLEVFSSELMDIADLIYILF